MILKLSPSNLKTSICGALFAYHIITIQDQEPKRINMGEKYLMMSIKISLLMLHTLKTQNKHE